MVKNGNEVFKFNILIHAFSISFIINLFVFLYSIYSFFDLKIFHNLQGSKLKIKNKL